MQDHVTLGGGLQDLLRFLGEVAFAWIPGTLAAIMGTGVGSNPPISIVNEPVGYGDFVAYVQSIAAPGYYESLFNCWATFVIISIIISLLAATFLTYCVIMLVEVREREYRHFHTMAHPVAAHDVPRSQARWGRIVEEAMSDNPQKWRLAILEAAIMLNALLDTLGHRGETMADKMREATREQFNTIDLAWDAHRMRNRVAHEGEQMTITERDVRNTINLYQRVFQEFNFV